MPPGVLQGLWVHLFPSGPWRIGPDSGDRDRVDRIFHSDSLFSAVSNAMARMGRIEEWLDATARSNDPAVRFSSCFPRSGDILFVPPPRNLWPPPDSSKVRWKAARFVPLSVVESLVQGRPIPDDPWVVDGGSECLIQAGASGPFRVSVRSNAAVDRDGASVDPHSTACIEFAPKAGLWMFAAFASDQARERWKEPVLGALGLLMDSGVGGERSRGWGRGSIAFSDAPGGILPFRESSGDGGWWMLSLFHPAAEDAVDWKRGNYALTTRGGRVESDARWGDAKKPTRMIAEGSVIVSESNGTAPRGIATNVAPEDFPHPVYRAGFALAVPVPLAVTPMPVIPAPVTSLPATEPAASPVDAEPAI